MRVKVGFLLGPAVYLRRAPRTILAVVAKCLSRPLVSELTVADVDKMSNIIDLIDIAIPNIEIQ